MRKLDLYKKSLDAAKSAKGKSRDYAVTLLDVKLRKRPTLKQLAAAGLALPLGTAANMSDYVKVEWTFADGYLCASFVNSSGEVEDASQTIEPRRFQGDPSADVESYCKLMEAGIKELLYVVGEKWDYSKRWPGHRLAKPDNVPEKEWERHYFDNPARDWSRQALRDFIASPGGEATANARAQLAFLDKYNLN